MTAWSTFALSAAEAAAEPFTFDDGDRLELDGGMVVTFGTRPDGTPAVLIKAPEISIMGIAAPRLGEFWTNDTPEG